MVTTVFPKSIKSRPIYGQLLPKHGTRHLMIADGEGATGLTDMLSKIKNDRSEFLNKSHIVYVPGVNGVDQSDVLVGLGAAQFYKSPTIDAAMPRLRLILQDARMGIQFYLSGTESLMGRVQTAIMETGYTHSAIQMEHRGSLSRRVQCVHCKGITENVKIDPFKCGHCGLHLFVRDHYSRRISAFQGVNIDAEDPGVVPPSEERFL
ncbi:MAG: hypothetical protein MUQ64_07175 [Paracoccaceae bacterium]|jgi:dimethylamine monooxygenase subunit C|nr:hypothetical protein [Paracoccaceae bacterium]